MVSHIHVSSPQGISTKHLKSQLHLPPVLKTLQVAVAKTQVAAAEIQPAKASHGKLVQQQDPPPMLPFLMGGTNHQFTWFTWGGLWNCFTNNESISPRKYYLWNNGYNMQECIHSPSTAGCTFANQWLSSDSSGRGCCGQHYSGHWRIESQIAMTHLRGANLSMITLGGKVLINLGLVSH